MKTIISLYNLLLFNVQFIYNYYLVGFYVEITHNL